MNKLTAGTRCLVLNTNGGDKEVITLRKGDKVVLNIGGTVDVVERKGGESYRIVSYNMDTVSHIQKIVAAFGSFSALDLEGERLFPVLDTMGKDHLRIVENIHSGGVDVITYVHGNVTNEEFIEYRDLGDKIINEIELLVEDYEAECIRAEKRTSA